MLNSVDLTISLPLLKSLRIDTVAPTMGQLLAAISAPALEFLGLDNIIEKDLVAIFERLQLQAYPHRFPCLQDLSVSLLRGRLIRQVLWTPFCSVFPHITHLTVLLYADEIYTLKPLMVALSLKIRAAPNSPPIPLVLPKLQTLSFNHESIGTVMLCDVVSNRAVAGHALSSLQPRGILDNNAYSSSLDWLREHVKVGEHQAEESNDDN